MKQLPLISRKDRIEFIEWLECRFETSNYDYEIHCNSCDAINTNKCDADCNKDCVARRLIAFLKADDLK